MLANLEHNGCILELTYNPYYGEVENIELLSVDIINAQEWFSNHSAQGKVINGSSELEDNYMYYTEDEQKEIIINSFDTECIRERLQELEGERPSVFCEHL